MTYVVHTLPRFRPRLGPQRARLLHYMHVGGDTGHYWNATADDVYLHACRVMHYEHDFVWECAKACS